MDKKLMLFLINLIPLEALYRLHDAGYSLIVKDGAVSEVLKG